MPPYPRLARLSALLLAALFAAMPLRAETDAEIEQAIAQIRRDIGEVIAETDKRDLELSAIRAFKRRMWRDWIQPWQTNDTAIRNLQAEVEALRRMRAFNQNSRDLNDRMRALLAERAELEKLRGGTVDDCDPPCTGIHQLFRYYDARVEREKQLVSELADLNRKSRLLDASIEAWNARLAQNKAARDKILAARRDKLTAERKRLSDLLAQPDTYILPSLDPGNPPRVLTKQDLILEITVTLFETATTTRIDSPEFRAEVEAAVRKLLHGSKDMRDRIGNKVTFLDDQIAALDARLGDAGAVAATAGQCPATNPDPTGQTREHRIPPGDDSDYLACHYFPDPSGGQAPGPIASRVRYADGKETGIVAFFSLEGGHHLEHIHDVHGPRGSGSKCTYHSASAISEYHLIGHDGTEMAVFCEPDGTVGQCDYITHDGRARRCSADCSDQCAGLRSQIGWPAMQ